VPVKKASLISARGAPEIIIPNIQSVTAPSVACLCFKVVETGSDGKAIVTYLNPDEFKYVRVEDQ
jgi:hypothetical protein